MNRFLKILGYAWAFVIFLLVLLAGFTQTKLFKDRLRYGIASQIASNTGASVSFGTIKGNFVAGFTIDSVKMLLGENEWISTGKISISYDLSPILRKHINIHRLAIERPRILLQRGEDSIWNISRLIKPSEQRNRAQPEGLFDWRIRVDTFTVTNGSIVVKDLVSLASPEHQKGLPYQVEYHDIALSDVHLECGGEYRNQNARLTIRHLKFESRQPRFELRQLSGEVSVTPKIARLQALLVETSRSHFKLNASLENINLFDGLVLEDLKQKPVKVNLLADNSDLNELKSFLAPVDFLSGSAYVDLEARGEFGNLSIERLDVQTYNSSIKLRGNIQNLHTPKLLDMNLTIRNSRVDPGDASKLLSPFGIPRFG